MATEQDRIPEGWDRKELARAVQAEGEVAAGEATVLTWQVIEDDRPWRVEKAIVWVCLQAEKETRWRLAHLARTPLQKRGRPDWRPYGVCDANQISMAGYERPPNNDEVYRFLQDSWWKFTPEMGFRLLDAAVCAAAWKSVTGQEPTQFFKGLDSQ